MPGWSALRRKAGARHRQFRVKGCAKRHAYCFGLDLLDAIGDYLSARRRKSWERTRGCIGNRIFFWLQLFLSFLLFNVDKLLCGIGRLFIPYPCKEPLTGLMVFLCRLAKSDRCVAFSK